MIRKAVIVVLISVAVALLLIGGFDLMSVWGIEGLDSVEYEGSCLQPVQVGASFIRPCWTIRRLRIEGSFSGSALSPSVDWARRIPLVGVFAYWAMSDSKGRRYWEFATPGWVLLIMILAYPVGAFIRGPVRRWRRRRRGECLRCGYNLTGNLSGICPECGTEIQQP